MKAKPANTTKHASKTAAGVKTRSGVGRPSGGDSERVRAQLLQAARSLFLSNEFKAVSIRQIADCAGVNGAMVSYYFGDKQGLYLAMVEELLQSLQQGLQELQPGSAMTITGFSSTYCRLLAANPWWPNFMVRDVLFSDGKIRAAIIEKMGTMFVPKLLQSIQREITQKNFRTDLDPRLTLLSIMGMTVFPFIAKPMIEQVLKIKVDAAFAVALSTHNTQLFLHGAQIPAPAVTAAATRGGKA